jgi:hypothetical protein
LVAEERDQCERGGSRISLQPPSPVRDRERAFEKRMTTPFDYKVLDLEFFYYE